MAASAIAGKGGSVKLNTTPVTTVALIDKWDGTLTQALYDQTSLGDSWTSDVGGLKDLKGTITGKWDVTADTGQTVLHNAILNGVTVGLNLLVNNTDGYELTANLDTFQTSDPVNGLVTFTCTFKNFGQVFFL